MDPMNRGPEEYGHDTEGDDAREGRGAPAPERGPSTAARARIARVVSGDLLLTVNPVDGSEIEACPPGEQPAPPRRRTAEERAEAARAAAPPVPPGPAAPPLPLLERQEEHERLVQLLARGRSVRVTGPAGSGRTALLDAVAADCAGLAPDGVVRLSGYHRTPTELLYDLFTTVQHAPDLRPDRPALLGLVHDIGAIVVVDDLEFGGTTLDELLAAAPECAFLLAATPDVPAPSPDAHLEEVSLAGLGRAAALALLESAVDRPLTDDEANWAGDLWFESEGLPLRFVQAGALLRQRDRLRVIPEEFDAFGTKEQEQEDAPTEFDAFGALDDAFGPAATAPAAPTTPTAPEASADVELREIPLPSLGEGAAPAALLASRLSHSAQDTLRFTVALGGEVPHQAHLPALVGDTHADAAVGELMACGLLSPVGARYRLAAGVLTQLLAQAYDEGAAARAHTVAQHYAWWAGHPSVTPTRAAAEADALLAALAALVPGSDPEHPATAVLLARSAAPAFAAGLHWGAWERALRAGQEAARLAGEVAEEAYFHHELGILALCAGNLQRARAELEASIGMRGVLADKRGTVAGRRALALVADRAGGAPSEDHAPAGDEQPTTRVEEPVSPPRGIPRAVVPASARTAPIPAFPDFADEGPTLITRPDAQPGGDGTKRGGRFGVIAGARRNLVAVGTGALLAAVLGTVVTIGATSGNAEDPGSNRVTSDRTASEDGVDDGLDADEPTEDSTSRPSESASPTPSGSPTSGTPSASGTPSSSSSPSGTPSTTAPTTVPPAPTTTAPRPTISPTTKPTPTKSPTPSTTSPTTPPTTPSTTPSTTTPPETTQSQDNPDNTGTPA
ncbi:ATP-binding protein [Streptomyces vilmorinianum]|uniref:ATP-binding protein n=1 Tax=Streptomyces vilmorinianum TaxID=3051092 RepID=UPI0010FAEE8E|nr:ATP-binding protein [Streptomyces vilmorinianum]